MANLVKVFAGNVKLLSNAAALRSARQFASARKLSHSYHPESNNAPIRI